MLLLWGYKLVNTPLKVASSPGHSCLFNVACRKGGGPGKRSFVMDVTGHALWLVGDEYCKMTCTDVSNCTAYTLLAALYLGSEIDQHKIKDVEFG